MEASTPSSFNYDHSSTPQRRPASSSISTPSETSQSTTDFNEFVRHRRLALAGDDEESNDDTGQIVLSVFWKGGKFGAAYYNCDTCEMFLVYDILDPGPDFLLLKSLFAEIGPTTILTSAKLDEDLHLALHKLTKVQGSPQTENSTTATSESGDELPNLTSRCKIQLLPSTYFEFEACRRRVFNIELPGQPANFSEQERLLHLSSIVPLDALQMIQATGALLRLLEQWSAGKDFDSKEFPILAMIPRPASKLFWMDLEAYVGLQIFSDDSHPSGAKRGTGKATKEGLSLFGIMLRCKSPIGRSELRLMFMRPICDLQILEERLAVVEFCSRSVNKDVVSSLALHIAPLRKVSRIFVKIAACQATSCEWQSLYKTSYHLICLAQLCRRLPSSIKLFDALADILTSQTLQMIVRHIHDMVDFEESKVRGRITVLPGVNTDLDSKKQQLNGVHALLSEVAQQELPDLPSYVTECSVVYFPEIGFLLCLPISRHLTVSRCQIPHLKFMFKIQDNLHYKSARCHELDNSLGKTFCEIIHEETKLVIQLSRVVLSASQEIRKALALACQLDALLSLATVAVEQNLVKPVFGQKEDGIQIEGGRHLLHQLCVDSFVPNDTQLAGPQQPRITIISGPNSSGKSVYLKQTALIVFLAHIGSFVPANKVILAPMKGLFCRVPSQESSTSPLSAFATDISQMVRALRYADGQSLVVVDEFGAGTCYLDGFSLLATFLQEWIAQGDQSPVVLVATHYHALFAHLPSTPLLNFKQMKLLCTEQEVVHLYQLAEGKCDNSQALMIASNVGMPASIIKRAHQTLEHLCTGTSLSREPNEELEAITNMCGIIAEEFYVLDMDTCDVEEFLLTNVLARWSGLEQEWKSLDSPMTHPSSSSPRDSSVGTVSPFPSVAMQEDEPETMDVNIFATPKPRTPLRNILHSATPRTDDSSDPERSTTNSKVTSSSSL